MKKSLFLITALLLISIAGCQSEKEITCSGSTMGTTYHVKVVAIASTAGEERLRERLRERLLRRLDDINRSMSTFLAESDISRFNDMTTVDDPLPVTDDFFGVMQTARYLHDVSGGAWDGTVMPLVDLWGFGPEGFSGEVPEREKIEARLGQVGFSAIQLGAGHTLSKTSPDVRLDLASIAKGYGVDAVAGTLRDLGYTNFLVEIGGEVYAEGVRMDGGSWRVGINRPRADAAADDVYHVVALSGRALATSGDYRNFFEMGGRRYSHVIDPRTGYPVANGVVSVSVVADTCAMADGLATAMMVMGADDAVALADRLPDVSCLVVVQEVDGSLTDHRSEGFILDE